MSALEHTIIVASIYFAALLVATDKVIQLGAVTILYFVAVLVLAGRTQR